MRIFWANEALLRLQEIEEYISKDNSIAAIEFTDMLICSRLHGNELMVISNLKRED